DNTFNVILNRIFEREDVFMLAIYLCEHRVHGRRFTATRRAGYEDETMRLVDGFLHRCEIALGKAELVQRNEALFAIKNTHHHLFAVVGGKGRNTEVDLAIVKLCGEATVLWTTLFIE